MFEFMGFYTFRFSIIVKVDISTVLGLHYFSDYQASSPASLAIIVCSQV